MCVCEREERCGEKNEEKNYGSRIIRNNSFISNIKSHYQNVLRELSMLSKIVSINKKLIEYIKV